MAPLCAQSALALTVAEAVRVFLMCVLADKQLPFPLCAPNTETRAAMAEGDEIVSANAHGLQLRNALFLLGDRSILYKLHRRYILKRNIVVHIIKLGRAAFICSRF